MGSRILCYNQGGVLGGEKESSYRQYVYQDEHKY